MHVGARYYEVETGRWVQKDKWLGSHLDPQTVNQYVYVVDNPVINIDPTGFRTIKQWMDWILAGIGAGIGGYIGGQVGGWIGAGIGAGIGTVAGLVISDIIWDIVTGPPIKDLPPPPGPVGTIPFWSCPWSKVIYYAQ